jgi:predicted nicotinamide N-methyase
MDRVPVDSADFLRAHAQLLPVAAVPEIVVYQAEDAIALWEINEARERIEQPPPFFAFSWAGGQALARHILDRPGLVAGRRVLDLASGSGLVAIAAAKAGAAHVRAVEIDPLAIAAIRINAEANGVAVSAELADILDQGKGDAEVVFAGDVFYSRAMADRMLSFLQRAAEQGAQVLIGDPDRAFLPRQALHPITTMDIPVPEALESTQVKRTTIWEVRPAVVS